MDKLMYEGLANIGDIIRGYDFAPCSKRGAYYIEGKVFEMGKTKHGFHAYSIKLIKRVRNGVDVTSWEELSKTFYVPFEKSDDKYDLEEYHEMGLTGRVEKIRDAL